MKRALPRALVLSAVCATLCGCTLVVARSPREVTRTATIEVQRPIEVYGTAAPTLTPTPGPTAPAPDLPTSTPAPTPSRSQAPEPSATPTAPPTVVHIVQSGDTLSEIAVAYGVPMEAIAEANKLADPGKLSVGQRLVIPGAAATEPAAEPIDATPSPQPEAAATTPAPSPRASPTEAEATPTAQPTDLAPSTPSPPSQTASVSESSVSINIADYAGALYPLGPEDVGYPYEGLDFSKVGPVASRQYRALRLENAYTVVIIVPDLGGRIYQITDKVSGRQMLYNNPAVVPSNWGLRGWWLAIGGMEWALPTEEHGLVEYLPWTATPSQGDGEASVLLSVAERLTGVECQVRVWLDSEHSYVNIAPVVKNPGNTPQRLQFWLNAMYAPGGVRVPPGTRLVFPAAQLLVHNTSDPGLPTSGSTMPWPIYGPRDLSQIDSWHGFLGAFASPRAQAPYMGAQSPGAGGLLRIFPPEVATGSKFFGLGDIPYTRYSQVDSTYLELWGGWTPSFWSYQELGGGQSLQWDERWYPLPDMPPIVAANADVALGLSTGEVALAVTRAVEVEIEAFAGAQSLHVWRAALAPGRAWRPENLPAGMTALEVRERASQSVLLRWPG